MSYLKLVDQGEEVLLDELRGLPSEGGHRLLHHFRLRGIAQLLQKQKQKQVAKSKASKPPNDGKMDE